MIDKFLKSKFMDWLGHKIFVLALLVLSPVLIVYGGVMFIIHYYNYVSDTVNNRVPKRYYF